MHAVAALLCCIKNCAFFLFSDPATESQQAMDPPNPPSLYIFPSFPKYHTTMAASMATFTLSQAAMPRGQRHRAHLHQADLRSGSANTKPAQAIKHPSMRERQMQASIVMGSSLVTGTCAPTGQPQEPKHPQIQPVCPLSGRLARQQPATTTTPLPSQSNQASNTQQG